MTKAKLFLVGRTADNNIPVTLDQNGECQVCEQQKQTIGVTDDHNNSPLRICKDCLQELLRLITPTKKSKKK